MYMIKDPLAKTRAIMAALYRGDRVEAERLAAELAEEDREATRREMDALFNRYSSGLF